MPGIEPGAFHMQSERSTTELHPLSNPGYITQIFYGHYFISSYKIQIQGKVWCRYRYYSAMLHLELYDTDSYFWYLSRSNSITVERNSYVCTGT
jgi:hypothetical protein